MGTFRYYRPAGNIPTTWWWIRTTILLGAAFYGAHMLDTIEDNQEIGAMYDKTFLYYNKHKNQEKYPNKLTFPRASSN